MKSFFLSHHCHDHLMKQCNTQNQVSYNGVNNDNIGQHVNAIKWKHNVNPLTWELKGRWRRNVGLTMCNMKTYIFCNGWKGILHGHHETLSSPHHECNEGGESPWGLKVGQKYNVTSQGPTNGGGPTWCTSQRRKHSKPNRKKWWLCG